MNETQFIWFNGEMVPWHDAKIHVLTHTLHYGGGAFEGIRFYETQKGPAIFKLGEHIDRLLYSASVLRMELPYDKAQICAAVKEVARVNGLPAGYLRPIAFFGYGKMGVSPVGASKELAIACWPWGAYLPHESVDIKTSHYIRIHPNSTITDAKLTGHYLNSILASLDIQGTHYHEILFLNTEGEIMEGGGENFFMMKAGTLYTPPLGGILPGITRSTIIELARKMGIHVEEKKIILHQAYEADEAFFTGTAAEVTPIRSIDDRVLNQGEIGEVTLKIKQAYFEIVSGKNPEYQSCLTFLN